MIGSPTLKSRSGQAAGTPASLKVHCPKNNLNLRIKTRASHGWSGCHILYNVPISQTCPVVSDTGMTGLFKCRDSDYLWYSVGRRLVLYVILINKKIACFVFCTI